MTKPWASNSQNNCAQAAPRPSWPRWPATPERTSEHAFAAPQGQTGVALNAPLAGIGVAVTRPAAQAAELSAAIAAAGGTPFQLPLLNILPAEDVTGLQAAAHTLASYAWVIFISPNAVAYGLPVLCPKGAWPPGPRPAAVGQGTVRTLAAHGVAGTLAPTERFDSEALLALPELAEGAVTGQRVLIVRGDGGRELLGETLSARGAHVVCVTAYRRAGPPAGAAPWVQALAEHRLQAVTVSSSEGLRHLLELLPGEARGQLAALPLFVPHVRIAETARAAGLARVVLTAAGDAGIVDALCAYPWRR